MNIQTNFQGIIHRNISFRLGYVMILFGLLAATYFASQIAWMTTVVATENEIKQVVEHHFLIYKTTI